MKKIIFTLVVLICVADVTAQVADSLYVPLQSEMIRVKKKSISIFTDAVALPDSLPHYYFRFATVNRDLGNIAEEQKAFNKLWKLKSLRLRVNGSFFTGYLQIAIWYSILRPGNVRKAGKTIYRWFFKEGRFEKEEILPENNPNQVELVHSSPDKLIPLI